MKVALNAYEELIKGLKEQMRTMVNTPTSYDRIKKEVQQILNRIEQINAKMENIVDEYTKNIGYLYFCVSKTQSDQYRVIPNGKSHKSTAYFKTCSRFVTFMGRELLLTLQSERGGSS